MIELWGLVHVVTSPAMKPLWEWLGSFSQDIAQDLLKDFVKDDLIISNWQRLPFTAQGRTVIRSLKSFVAAMEQELDRLGCAPDVYVKPLKTFIKDRDGAALLGTALNLRQETPDPIALADLWDELGVRSLPEGFDWSAVATAYRSAVQAIVRDSAELRSIAQFELTAQLLEGQQATADLLADRLGPAVDFDLEAYARSIQTTCGKLPLDQLATDGGAYSVKLWQVFLPQRARECGEYLPQLDKAPKELLRQYGLLEKETDARQQQQLRELYRRQAPRSVLELAADSAMNLLVILGDPGSGKSTLLKYLALDWATYENELCRINDIRPLDQLLARPLPLLVKLRKLSCESSLDILNYFHSGNVFDRLNKSQLHDQLIAGRALLLFDGLDEVFEPARREAVIREICRLAHEYPATKIIVTSRVYGYQNYARSLTNHGFRHWLLEEFDDTQIKNFCDRWHQETFETSEKADRDRCRKRLGNAIAQRRTIRELAGNPLMLTMMCILNRKSQLPDERLEFYRQATDLLLRDWDVEHKNLPDRCQEMQLTLNQKHKIVRRVAFYLQNTKGGLAGNLIREADLQAIVADYLRTLSQPNPEGWAEALIDSLRVRNFTLCSAGTGYYAFVHRTFLEYFCATEIYERFGKRGSESQSAISTDDLIHKIFGQRWRDDAWREVLLLLAIKLDIEFSEKALASLVELDEATSEKADFANLFLAADCLAELPERSTIADLDRDLLQRLRSLTTWETLRNSDSLEDWDPNDEIFNQRILKVRRFAVTYIAQHWKDHPKALTWLNEWVSNDKNWSIREAAVAAIVQHWRNDPSTLPLLKKLVHDDQDDDVMRTAAQAIAQYWSDDPNILSLLKDRACSDKNTWVRRAAVQVIAQYWSDCPDTLPWLKERVHNDYDTFLRQAAVQVISQYWSNHPDTLPWLKERVRHEKDNNVLYAVVESIAQYWSDDTDTLPWLKERIKTDETVLMRFTVLNAIVHGWPNKIDTYIAELVFDEEDESIRKLAVDVIVQYYLNYPDKFNLLCELTTQDLSQRDKAWHSSRQMVLSGLLEIAPENPQVVDLLRDRAANDPDDLLREWATKQLTKIDPQQVG